jgi:hypothetical protein
MNEVPSISDPYFVQTANLSDTKEVLGSTILTSRTIVLSPAGEASSQVGKAVVVADTGNLTVFGDVVRISGVICAPGRTIKIFCRRLEFYPGTGGSGISVNGKRGANKNKATSLAGAGKDGQLNPTSIRAANGINGQDGGHGDPGNPGGEIQIYCGILVPFSDVVLSAEGGAGGNGADGQDGGRGGNGFSGYPTESYPRPIDPSIPNYLPPGANPYDYFGDRAHGGYGGCGGNGGNGGNGGAGGRITFHFMRLGNPQGSFQITANAAGGGGGNGAKPGEGGKGGNGGVPDPKRGPAIGARAGGGGTCGLPGHRGYGGPMGRVNLGIPLPVIPESTTGGDDLGQPAAGIGILNLSSVSWGPNRLDVFVTCKDNHVRHNSWNGSNWQTTWDDRGQPAAGIGTLVADPESGRPIVGLSSVSWGPNRLDVFVTGADNHVRHNSWNGSNWQTTWDDRGQPATGIGTLDLSSVSWGANRLDVFVACKDNHVRHNSWNGSNWQTTWDDLGQPRVFDRRAKSSVAVGILGLSSVSWGPNRLDVFATDKDSHVRHNSWNGSNWQTTWDDLGQPAAGIMGILGLSSVSCGANRLDVFVTCADNHVRHNSWNGSNWQTTWADLGQPAAGIGILGLSSVSWGANRLDVFVTCADNHVRHNSWNGSNWQKTWDDRGQLAAGIGILGLSSVSWGANRLDVFATGADNHVRTIDRKMIATRIRLSRWQYFYNTNTEDEKAFRERLDKSLKFSIPEERTDGLPGQSFANPNQATSAGTPGPGGAVPSPSLLRNEQRPDPGPPAANYNIADFQAVAYSDLAVLADLDQLEMLFDYTRGRYLLTSLSTVSNDIIDAVTWLVLLGESKDSRLKNSAAATLENLGKGRNIFSNNAQSAALGNLEKCEKDLMAMLTLYAPVEATEKLLRSAENSLTERKAYLENVFASQQSLVERLTTVKTKKVAEAQAVLVEVKILDNARLQTADSLAIKLQDLTIAISDTVKLTSADFVNLFSQLSFTNRDLMNPALTAGASVSPSGVAATGAMLASQAIDMATKAIENVPSDLGGSVNKKYVVRRMEYLQGTVKDLAGLKQSRDGLLKTNPSAEMRLLATRDQVESICSNFYESYPAAKVFSYLLDEYIEKVTARNEKVEEFNQLLSDVLYLDTEIGKTQVQQNQAATSIQTSANPGLPAMARYATALRRHAQERCVYQLYKASRVFTMQSLQSYDVFADVLGKLTSQSAPGEISSAALNTGLIDLISQKLEASQNERTSQSDFIPEGNRCSITLTPKTHSLLFKLLKSGESGSFTISPATPNTTLDQNPFARMADVRLTHIRCLAPGMKTGNGSLLIELTHPGIETFVTEGGKRIRLNHPSTTVSRTYNTVTGLPVGNGALDENHRMIGPFCEWIVSIPRQGNTGLDLTALESLKIDFEGKSRSFPKTEEPETAGEQIFVD